MEDELSQKAIAEDLYTKLEDYRGSTVSRLFNDVWNQNQVPYIIGYADAAKALATYKPDAIDDDLGSESPAPSGVFAALGLAEAYYNNEIGEPLGKDIIVNPEKLADEVSLIRAQRVLASLDSLNGEGVDSEAKLTDDKIKEIQEELEDKFNF